MILTKKQKKEIIKTFYEWTGGSLPTEHFWEKNWTHNESDIEGKTFFAEDHSNIAPTKFIIEWLEQLDEDDAELNEYLGELNEI